MGSPAERAARVADAVARIEACPAWSELGVEDTGARREVIEALESLAAFDLDVVRDAVRVYRERREASEEGYDVAAMSRLYVLVRYLFRAPRRGEAGQRRFGSFFGVPAGEGWVDELWPLSEAEGGRLRLTGVFGGYFGESYLALEEFDHFRRAYGPRDPRGSGRGTRGIHDER